MTDTINVTYQSTSNAYDANQFLHQIRSQPLFAADFEAASRYTPAELSQFEYHLANSDLTKFERIELENRIEASGLSHPAHSRLTHCSIATSPEHAYVFILDNKRITDLVLNFLVTTPIRQIWHNASFDFKHILHHTGRMPILYEDSQLFAKCILNHVDTTLATVGLKELAGHKYGTWAISPDNFDISQMYESHVLHYAAIDACATYWLYNSILSHVQEASSDSET